jgi:hypothetical protein
LSRLAAHARRGRAGEGQGRHCSEGRPGQNQPLCAVAHAARPARRRVGEPRGLFFFLSFSFLHGFSVQNEAKTLQDAVAEVEEAQLLSEDTPIRFLSWCFVLFLWFF